MTKVKRVKLDTLSKIQPGYAGAEGIYNPNTDTIYLDATLPKTPRPTYASALSHERGHALLEKSGTMALFGRGREERFCWLYALALTPRNGLTHLEYTCRQLIFERLSWKRPKDRQRIVETIMGLCQVQPTREAVAKLSGGK